jgi:hypothetical protein
VTDQRFIRAYRIAVLAVGFLWRMAILNPFGARHALEAVVLSLGIGLLPYAALACLAACVRVRWVLVAAASAAFGLDLWAWLGARLSHSSTAGVAVMLVPLYSLVLVLPVAALVAWLVAPRSGRR